MVAHAVANYTPDDQIVAFHDVPRWVGRILRLENQHAIASVQALADWLGVDRGNHDIAVLGFVAAVYDEKVARENTGALHAVALYLHQVHVRSAQIEQLVKRDAAFHVIRRW